MREDHPPTLLLVEDDPGHARLIERNLQRAHLSATASAEGVGRPVPLPPDTQFKAPFPRDCVGGGAPASRRPFPYAIVVLRDGQAALDYLFPAQQEQGTQHPPPSLVLLDLNLPGCCGVDVLARLKSDARTRYIPVVVLTTTHDRDEIETCYALGCNAYLTKPVAYEQFVEMIQKLGWWLTGIEIPRGSS